MRSKFDLTAPWAGLGAAEKFLAYNRWSLQATIIIFAVLFAIPAWPSWTVFGMAASAISAVWVLFRQPALRMESVTMPAGLVPAGVVLNIALIIAAALTHEIPLTFLCLVSLLTAFTSFLPNRKWWTLAVSAVGTVLLATMGSVLLAVVCIIFTTYPPLVLWTVGLMIEADRARILESRLRVSEERLRFAQDLHDTLGQNLAGMSIKAQLAAKLAELGDPRLPSELAELQELVDGTVADMHGVVDNYGSPDLVQEISGAVGLLEQSGITVRVDGSAAAIPEAAHETAAWFIREAATNVLRHSRATEAELTLSPRRIALRNNEPEPGTAGTGSTSHTNASGEGTRPGRGLENLRRRATGIGATIGVEQTPTTYTATLELP